jgi:acetyl esterase/lipase
VQPGVARARHLAHALSLALGSARPPRWPGLLALQPRLGERLGFQPAALGRRARSAGVGGTRVRLEIWPEMQHFFQLGVGVYPEAQEALDVAGEWLARRLDVTRT